VRTCKKRNRPHKQTHDKNNTTQYTTRTTPQTTTRGRTCSYGVLTCNCPFRWWASTLQSVPMRTVFMYVLTCNYGSPFGPYTKFVYFKTGVHESTILSPPPPTCTTYPGAILLHDYWTVYDSPSDLPFVCYTPNNIGNNNIV